MVFQSNIFGFIISLGPWGTTLVRIFIFICDNNNLSTITSCVISDPPYHSSLSTTSSKYSIKAQPCMLHGQMISDFSLGSRKVESSPYESYKTPTLQDVSQSTGAA